MSHTKILLRLSFFIFLITLTVKWETAFSHESKVFHSIKKIKTKKNNRTEHEIHFRVFFFIFILFSLFLFFFPFFYFISFIFFTALFFLHFSSELKWKWEMLFFLMLLYESHNKHFCFIFSLAVVLMFFLMFAELNGCYVMLWYLLSLTLFSFH